MSVFNNRQSYLHGGACLSIAFAIISLFAGVFFPDFKSGKYLVGIWVLAPPIYFWYDWHYLVDRTNKDKMDFAKATYERSSAIWVAFAAILATLFGVKIGG